MSIRFSLLHATARPAGWHRAYELWTNAPGCRADQVEYILAIDTRWFPTGLTLPPLTDFLHPIQVVWSDPAKCCVGAWNAAARASHGQILITVADDWFPCPRWAEALTKVIERVGVGPSTNDFAIWVSAAAHADQAGIMSYAIISRARYERFNYIYHPGYRGHSCDYEFTMVARAEDAVIDARFLTFPHVHPSVHPSMGTDDVYDFQYNQENVEHGTTLFERRKALGFPKGG